MVRVVGSWGVASVENDAAGDWFLTVEEAPDPSAVMAAAIDDVLSAAEYLEVDLCVRRSLPRSSAPVALVSCRIGCLTTFKAGFRTILTGRTRTRSRSRRRPSVGCAKRASCVNSGKSPETVPSGGPKWMISSRGWGDRAPGARPPCLRDWAPDQRAIDLSGFETRSRPRRGGPTGRQHRPGVDPGPGERTYAPSRRSACPAPCGRLAPPRDANRRR